MKPAVAKIFDDLEQYLDFCRFDDKRNDNFRAFNAYRRDPKSYRYNFNHLRKGNSGNRKNYKK
jgi:hypothetical protein